MPKILLIGHWTTHARWKNATWEQDDDAGGVLPNGEMIVKEKPDPPPSWFDDEHPLADHYRLFGYVTPSEIWFVPYCRDLEIPEEKKPE
jgi:hypothetical protein